MNVMFVENADLNHQDARDFYQSYGWCLSTENAGDICHDAIEYDWLDDQNDGSIVAKLMAEDGHLEDYEAAEVVAKAREIREAGEAVESQLAAAVEAYEADDYAACLEALRWAGEAESPFGDTPASDRLRGQLIVPDVVEQSEIEFVRHFDADGKDLGDVNGPTFSDYFKVPE